MDDTSDPNNTNLEDHYGIFNADGTPKLAATAIKNLISILENGDNGTKSGNSFGYQLNNAPGTANSLLLEKSNGDFDIAVWNDIRLWTPTSYTPVAAGAPIPVTLNFGQLVQSVTEYDPLSGTSAMQTWSNVSSISFALPDHPVIFEVQPYPAAQLSLANYDVSESLSSNQSTANLWSQLIANAIESNPSLNGSLTISAVSTTGTAGTVSYNAATKSLVYTAPAYNGLNPADSFTYTVSDSAGNKVTGTIAITELPNPNTTYATVAGAAYSVPANWTMVSLATGQSFGGSSSGGDTFILDTDTIVWGYGSNDTIIGGNGNFANLLAGVDNAHVTLGNGNSTIYVSGINAVITTGNGNNVVWRPTGYATITMGNGNEQITAIGLHNTVSIGTGTSTSPSAPMAPPPDTKPSPSAAAPMPSTSAAPTTRSTSSAAPATPSMTAPATRPSPSRAAAIRSTSGEPTTPSSCTPGPTPPTPMALTAASKAAAASTRSGSAAITAP